METFDCRLISVSHVTRTHQPSVKQVILPFNFTILQGLIIGKTVTYIKKTHTHQNISPWKLNQNKKKNNSTKKIIMISWMHSISSGSCSTNDTQKIGHRTDHSLLFFLLVNFSYLAEISKYLFLSRWFKLTSDLTSCTRYTHISTLLSMRL